LTLLFLSFGSLGPDIARIAVDITALFTAASWLAYGVVLLQAFAARRQIGA